MILSKSSVGLLTFAMLNARLSKTRLINISWPLRIHSVSTLLVNTYLQLKSYEFTLIPRLFLILKISSAFTSVAYIHVRFKLDFSWKQTI